MEIDELEKRIDSTRTKIKEINDSLTKEQEKLEAFKIQA